MDTDATRLALNYLERKQVVEYLEELLNAHEGIEGILEGPGIDVLRDVLRVAIAELERLEQWEGDSQLKDGETLQTDYICPDCGAWMTSGLQGGGYKVEPHCSRCNFKTGGGEDPWDACIPARYTSELVYVLAYVSQRQSPSYYWVDIVLSDREELPQRPETIGFIKLGPVVSERRETRERFKDRAYQQAQKALNTLGYTPLHVTGGWVTEAIISRKDFHPWE